MSDELIALKEKADLMGIAYKANIGVEALRNKINHVLANDGKAEDVDDETGKLKDVPPAAAAPAKEKTRAELDQEIRTQQMKEQMALVRIRITCLNPAKKNMPGEIITVGNKYIGTVRKMVPFGEATDEGYHVPRIILNELKSRKFNSIRIRKGTNGTKLPEQRLVPEFAIEELEPLTPEELQNLARNQAAKAGL